MNVAIIGAGFSGLAVAWHLLKAFPSCQLSIFDQKKIGEGTSGIAAGLLHPFSGAHAKLNPQGFEGMAATHELLAMAAHTLNRPVVSPQHGLLRLALTAAQIEDFQKSAKRYFPHVQWLESETCQTLIPGCAVAPGLWIPSALTVYAKTYLSGLWQACAQQGAQFYQQKIQSLNDLSSFQIIIVTTGAEISQLPECAHLPINAVKGQVLEFTPPAPLLNYPVNSHAYLLMSETQQSCLAGATYERKFQTDKADWITAKEDILPKAFVLYPSLKESQVIGCAAGLRASAPGHLPFIQRLSSRTWVLTGMGSKGLLYHALYAKKLVEQLHLPYAKE